MFGSHINRYHAKNKSATIAEHIEAARIEALNGASFVIKVVAIFVGGPKNRKISLRPDERAQLINYIERTKIRVIAHSAYSAYPWRGDDISLKYIRDEINVCREAGISGLVIHLPKLPIDDMMQYIPHIHDPVVRIYLETPAAIQCFETVAKLANLFATIRAAGFDNFGLCIDTAHLWTAGVDLQTYDAAQQWLQELENVSDIIPASSVMIHLNDSAREKRKGPDAHASLTQGKIWGEYKNNIQIQNSGLAAFVDYALRNDTMTILERKPREVLIEDYFVLRNLIPPA
ncbi:probable endonuclease 4 [Hydra vulgaris]|uniref:Probable endonuclease 4 n=1 Tax=Hydra vulgaris TaxID=6087 RepID=A0ABM4BNT9_HYDVU